MTDLLDRLQDEADKHDGEIDELGDGTGYTATFSTQAKAIEAARGLARVHKGPISGPIKGKLTLLKLKGLM